jgi:hypothetical protein
MALDMIEETAWASMPVGFVVGFVALYGISVEMGFFVGGLCAMVFPLIVVKYDIDASTMLHTIKNWW